MKHFHSIFAVALTASAASLSTASWSATDKLLLTGGVSTIDGAAGGGITPWAVIGSNATANQIGGTVNVTRANTSDYGLSTQGASIGFQDRVELSFGKQDFNTRQTGVALGLSGLHLKQSIVGLKFKVAGDAILNSDSFMPQIAVGLIHKSLDKSGLSPTLNALGAKESGTDVYVSATKLFLAQGVLVNGTLRATKANQNGLLGFGGTLGGNYDTYKLMPELSVAYLISKNIAIGAEYRKMPNNLQQAGFTAGLGADGLKANAWKDIFIAWAPSKNVSVTAAYVDLGGVVPATTNRRKQTGGYVSVQFAI